MKKLIFLMIMVFVVLMMGGSIPGNVYAADKCDNPLNARPIPINYSECMNVCAECNRQEVARCDDQYNGDTAKHKDCLKNARDKYDSIRDNCTIFKKQP